MFAIEFSHLHEGVLGSSDLDGLHLPLGLCRDAVGSKNGLQPACKGEVHVYMW